VEATERDCEVVFLGGGHQILFRLGVFRLPHAGRFPEKTGGDDMIDPPLIVNGGHFKVLIQSLFLLRGRLVLVAFHPVIIEYRKNISPTHKNSLTGSFFFAGCKRIKNKL